MSLRIKLASVGVGAVALLGGATVPVIAAPTVAAASCPDNGWSTKDGLIGHVLQNGVNIRSGPSTACPSLGQAQTGHSLRYDCYKDASSPSWSHVRDNTTGVSGWIRDDLLQYYGADTLC